MPKCVWQAEDGQTFPTHDEAARHDRLGDFVEFMRGTARPCPDVDDLIAWLGREANWQALERLVNGRPGDGPGPRDPEGEAASEKDALGQTIPALFQRQAVP